ncbi:MAG TPA: DUF5103 domain-containing protein [Bacteroidia bacterium]|nr:DUF5103 domain-containing protein [Bacteroidia bacterium]HRG53807.1 DUF5103 domain-containing protein [Bacteroidia bacterium]
MKQFFNRFIYQSLLSVSIFIGMPAKGQPPVSPYKDLIFNKNIRTIELRNPDFGLSQAILYLNSTGTLKLGFDDLSTEMQSYSYTFIHCNSNWEPSGLLTTEYIDGFAENAITDYQFSANTLQKYVHYSAEFPSPAFRFTKSGNYILKVYLANSADDAIFTRRFLVVDPKITATANVHAASVIEDRNYKQEIDFTVEHPDYPISNVYSDLKVVVVQNNHWVNARSGLKPQYVKDQQIVYSNDQDNVFSGGNEFRNINIKSLSYHSERVAQIKQDSFINHVILLPDEKRSFKAYATEADINGNFVIKAEDAVNKNSDTEADYCTVSFFLPCNEVFTDGNLYIFGGFNGWEFDPENKLTYDVKRMGYMGNLYLKQGYYNYEYAFLKDDSQEMDETLIEGSHSVTENEYAILIYHRFPGTFYDQLILVKRINSLTGK